MQTKVYIAYGILTVLLLEALFVQFSAAQGLFLPLLVRLIGSIWALS